MDFMHIYNDETLRCQNNLVSPNMLVPGELYLWQYNSLVILLECKKPWENNYVIVKFIVYNRHLTTNSCDTPLYTNRCHFYKIEKSFLQEIKNSHVVPPVPTLRVLAYKSLDDDEQIEYSYSGNVYGQFPPIPPETIRKKTKI
jgi:hypothetical protein